MLERNHLHHSGGVGLTFAQSGAKDLRGRVKDTNLVTCQNPWELSTLMWSSFANDLEYVPLSRGVHEAQD